jgi:acetolactate synthase-1/2/3 large subunit
MRSQVDVITHGFGALAVSALDGAHAVASLRELAAHALSTGRPVYLGVPADVLASSYVATVAGTASPHAAPLPATRSPGTPTAVGLTARAAEADGPGTVAALVHGRRVVLWLGARAVPCETDVAALASSLDATVLTTYQARGLLAGHPGLLDAPPHEPAVAAVIADAEVLLVVGDDLHGMTTRNWTMPVPATIVAITDDAGASLGDYPLAARLDGDVGSSVRGLLGALGDGPVGGPGPPLDVAAVRAAVWDGLEADDRTATARELVRSIDDGWPDSGALVVDMCVAGYWLGGYSHQARPRRLQYPVGWGTLGYALPAAIGPAAHGIPTLAVVGDGGAAMGLGELATYAQERLPLALLVVTDSGYGMLRYDQTVAGDPHRGVDLVEPRWEDLASAYGMRVTRTDDPGVGLSRALTQARDGLTCGDRWMVVLECALFPPRTTSPRWREG